jgi:hypothetical protein
MDNEKNKQEKIRIVVVDSGIDSEDDFLRDSIKDEIGYILMPDTGIMEERKPPITNMHGTLVAKTIKYTCRDVEFVSINILNENLSSDGRVLIKALQRAADFKPRIVHLSLGTTKLKYWYPLKKITTALNKNNIVVVSAASNEGSVSYPAYFSNVVGAKGIDSKENTIFYYEDKFFYSSLYLPSQLRESNKKYNYIRGNSIAAAYITGHISNSMLQQNTKDNKSILENFKSKSLNNLTKIIR